VKAVLNNIAMEIHKCDNDDQCARRRMCVKIIYSHSCCSLLIISSTKARDYYLASLYCQLNAEGFAVPEGVTTATHIVTLNSSGFEESSMVRMI
jgi:hypothetical protein